MEVRLPVLLRNCDRSTDQKTDRQTDRADQREVSPPTSERKGEVNFKTETFVRDLFTLSFQFLCGRLLLQLHIMGMTDITYL